MKRRKRNREEDTVSPSVKEALAHLKAAPRPEADWWEEAREAFLAQARTELGGDQAFPEKPEPVTSDNEHVNSEAGLKAFLLPLWERRPESMLARLVVALGIVLGGTLGTVEAARSSLPGSALYPVKLRVEELRMESTQDPEDRIERLLEAAEERLEDARRLAEQGETIPGALADLYAEQLQLASQEIQELSEPVRSEVHAEVAEELQEHLDEIHELQLVMGEEDDSLATMVSALEDLASQIGGLSDDLGDEDEDEVWDDDADDDEDDSDELEDADDLDPEDDDEDSDLDDEDDSNDEDSVDPEDDDADADDDDSVDFEDEDDDAYDNDIEDPDDEDDDEHHGATDDDDDRELDDGSEEGDDEVDNDDDDSAASSQDDDSEDDDDGRDEDDDDSEYD